METVYSSDFAYYYAYEDGYVGAYTYTFPENPFNAETEQVEYRAWYAGYDRAMNEIMGV